VRAILLIAETLKEVRSLEAASTKLVESSCGVSTVRFSSELAIKVSADQQNRPHLMELIKVFRARVVDVAPESLIIEVFRMPSTKSTVCSKSFRPFVCLRWPVPDGFP